MPNYKTPASQWCILRTNSKLRELVKFKIEQSGKTQLAIAKDLGTPSYRISKYIHNKTPNLSQFELIRLCNYLGIEVSLDINIV